MEGIIECGWVCGSCSSNDMGGELPIRVLMDVRVASVYRRISDAFAPSDCAKRDDAHEVAVIVVMVGEILVVYLVSFIWGSVLASLLNRWCPAQQMPHHEGDQHLVLLKVPSAYSEVYGIRLFGNFGASLRPNIRLIPRYMAYSRCWSPFPGRRKKDGLDFR